MTGLDAFAFAGIQERLARRDYGEEGIPMVLMADGAASSGHAALDFTDMFRDVAGLIPPTADQTAQARLLETIAAVEFGDEGWEPSVGREAERLAHDIRARLGSSPMLRVVNYHRTPERRAGQYDRAFARYAERFSPVTEDDLQAFLDTGAWTKPKPGLILAFYNGYRSNHEVARPLLDRHGLTGWFFVVTGFVGASDAAAFGARHGIPGAEEDPALTWSEIAHLAEGHVVASHTRHHSPASLVGEADLWNETVGAQEDFLQGLGRQVSALAWRGGAALGQHPRADGQVRRAGYRFVFSNLRVQRV